MQVLGLAVALCAIGWAGILFPPTAATSRQLLVQSVGILLWPLGWAIFHGLGVVVVLLACGWLVEGFQGAPQGALFHSLAILPWSRAFGGGVLAVGGSGFLLASIPGIPLFLAWLLARGAGAVGFTEACPKEGGAS